jgi:protein-disulfide isomerase
MISDARDPSTTGSAGLDPEPARAAVEMADAELPSSVPRSIRGSGALVFGALALAGISVILSVLTLMFAAGVLPPLRGAGFERELRTYILANPEAIVESVNSMEQRQKVTEENELTAILLQRHDEVFNDPSSPVGVNPRGNATVVEFFDYNCPYCRKATPILDELEQADKGLRLVFKEYPILGPGSVFAARAALASQKQGRYLAFHKAMMAYTGQITEGSSLEIAAQVGLDVERLKKDMEDPTIDEAIKRNVALAGALRISGTPTFIAGKEILRGLADVDTMKQLVASARGG